MGIPILDEIFAGMRWLIDFFVNKIPRPAQILLFLFFMLLFGFIISFTLHLVGVHCNSDLDPVKVSALDFSTNLRIIGYTKDDAISGSNVSICEAHPDKCGQETDCFTYARQLNGQIYEECTNESNTTGCLYLYESGYCFDCNYEEICFNPVFGFICTWYDYCLGDVYGNSDDFACLDVQDCSIPTGYIWNSTSGAYDCYNQTICGVNATKSLPIVDDKLEQAGAELLYSPSTDREDYTRLIGVTCSKNLNPELSFYGIPLFNYQIWLVIMIIATLFIFISKIKNN